MKALAFEVSCQFCGEELAWRDQQSGCVTERVAIVRCTNRLCRQEQYLTLLLRPLRGKQR